MSEEADKDIEVHGPGGTSFRARGYDILTLCVTAGLAATLIMLYGHTKVAENSATEAAVNAKETSRAIREMTCVMSIDQDKRLDQIGREDSYCKRMAK